MLSRLEHPNIVSYFDSFEEEGVLMIEMEYADGGCTNHLILPLERRLVEWPWQEPLTSPGEPRATL